MQHPNNSEQRDRAESEKIEERELHEREIAEYKMKLHSFESEVDKLTTRLHRALAEKDRLESKLECSQSELGKSKAELDKAATDMGRIGNWETTNQKIQRLEIENDRLRGELERSQVGARRKPIDVEPTSNFCVCQQTTFGRNTLSTSQELDRVQERADKTTAELRRTQAELRVTQVSNFLCFDASIQHSTLLKAFHCRVQNLPSFCLSLD